MQTTGLLVIGWKLALALVAGIPILTTIGVFLLARFTSVFDAYAGERAKLLAQFHNLDRLVEQTEKLTATTETIKARISDEVWDRQMRWTYLRDTYEKLMEALAKKATEASRNLSQCAVVGPVGGTTNCGSGRTRQRPCRLPKGERYSILSARH